MEFLTAYFANNERTIAKAIYVNEDGAEVPYVVKAEEGNPQWEKILEHMSIDELHESTYKYIKRLEEDYKTQVMVFAKERGMLLDLDAANGDTIKGLLQVIFEPSDDYKKMKETLFAFKLALFEFDAIKDSQERELKTALRKAESITASLRIALDIVERSKKAD